MVALILCGLAFAGCYLAGRRSLAAGLMAVVTVGYFYGIVRANVPSALSHFIFDAGVFGLYAAQLFRPLEAEDRARIQPLMPWIAALIGWPALLVLLPLQDPMIQLVGLRAHIYFLPFLYLGARLRTSDVSRLTLWLAALNLVVFGFAVGEFVLGVERFYPRNEVTELIYRSRDINTAAGFGLFRIPATFGNAALYGSTMVMTLPLLIGAWMRDAPEAKRWKTILMLAIGVTALGVFFSATRTNLITLGVIGLAAMAVGRFGTAQRLAWIGLIGLVAWAVSMEERLFQRLLTLNFDTVLERLSWSINSSLISFTFEFPLGNGLGGGGTNIPYFLQHLVRNSRSIENQYGTILLEQGVPGLFLWLAFILWALTRKSGRGGELRVARRLVRLTAALLFAQAVLGQGLFTAVPLSALLLLSVGWMVVAPREAVVPVRPYDVAPGPPRPLQAQWQTS